MKKLYIKYFKAFSDELKIDFNNKNFLLYGENGSGKSSVYEALKIIFFNKRIKNTIPDAVTPEEQEQKNRDFWSKYNNTNLNRDFEIKINETDFQNFSTTDYQLFMVSLEDLFIDNKINLNLLLQRSYTDIADIDKFCSDKHSEIEKGVNRDLELFMENINIKIDEEEDFNIKIEDPVRNIDFTFEIKQYFNEAKLNLVILLLLFNSIKTAKKNQITSKNKILVLDDFITSLDAANRTFLMKYVFDNFSDFQILIFTHNISFYNLIMYLVNKIYNNNNKWRFANLYEINNKIKFYFKDPTIKVSGIRNEFNNNQNNKEGNFDEIGTKIRKKFEILLYEFSKLLMIGAVEESKKILIKIENSKNIYFKEKNTASDLIDKIYKELNEDNPQKLKNSLKKRIEEYKCDKFQNFKKIIKELTLYQKVTMHPLSHGSVGQSSFTRKEIEKSIELLEKFESQLANLVNKNVVVI